MPHDYSKCIEILSEKADPWRNFCICVSCRDVIGRPAALLQKMPNKSERIRNHLRKCVHFKEKYPDRFEEFFGSTEDGASNPKRSRISASSSASFSSFSTLDSYVVRSPSQNNKRIFERLLIRATASAGWALQWVDNKEVKELFQFLNPNLKLPNRRALGGRILDNESKALQADMKQRLQNDSIGVTLAFDGWTNVTNQNILGSVLITSEGEVLIWKGLDISGEFERWKEVVERTEIMIKEIEDMKANLIAIVSDSAPSYAAARRRLRLKYVHLTFLPCFAHQTNLCLGEVFKESEEFKQASTSLN